ncbi:hypothetical protein SBA3_260014 [Candidatus Sulfopaludibacter sp. SbA3]|nr:hypothetical protein SBA3_260014 [Candidatus Sulfopaludibacter sp. SbA3]
MIGAEALRHPLRPSDAAILQNVGELFFDLLLHPGEAAVAQDEFHARHILVLAIAELVKHADDGFAPVEQALFRNEVAEQLRFHRQGSQAAANHHAEAALAFANHGFQSDVVHRPHDAIAAGTAIERDLEFARQVAGQVLAEKGVGHALGVGAHIENFVVRDPRLGAGGDVTHGVVAGLAIGQAGVGEHVHEVWHAHQRHEVILDVLPRGEVALAAAELVGDTAELLQLWRGQQSARDLAAHHLHARLALAVDAVLQTEGTELVFRNLSVQKLLRSLAKRLDFLADGKLVLPFEILTMGKAFLSSCRHNHLYLYRDYIPTITPNAIGIADKD